MDFVTPTPQPSTPKTPNASRIILILLYPVVLAVGVTVGYVLGVKQGQKTPTVTNQTGTNQPTNSSTVIPNVNNFKGGNANGNTNQNVNASLNVNSTADFLNLDAATVSALNQAEEQDKTRLVDVTVPQIDINRQQDLISIQYDLKAYFAVRSSYPSTNGKQIRLNQGTDDTLYAAMKTFYGGNYYQPIDPQSPTYYYGYTSDGQSYTLTALIVKTNKPFILQEP